MIATQLMAEIKQRGRSGIAVALTPDARAEDHPLFFLDGVIYEAWPCQQFESLDDQLGTLEWQFNVYPVEQYHTMPDCPGRQQFEALLARIPADRIAMVLAKKPEGAGA